MLVEGGKKYDVRLIPQTCNREDAIREIVGALDHLDAISDAIFSTVRARLNSHKQQVEALTIRVTAASNQISSLKGTQKAIRVTSPAKYPCEIPSNSGLGNGDVLEHLTYPALVARNIPAPRMLGLDGENDERRRRPFRFDTAIKHPNDLLSIFHVKEPKLGDLSQLDNVADVGLGRPPPTIRNMDSFFLFNTIDNPYQNYKMTERSLQDRNFGTLKPTRKGEEAQAEICPTVPTVNETGAEAKTDQDDFYYNPSALEIPDIDVPECLPDLPGIAESFDITEDLMSPMFSPKPFTLSSVPSQTPPSSNQTPPISSFLQDKGDNFFSSTPEEPSSKIQQSFTPPTLPKTNIMPSTSAPVVPPPPPPPPPMITPFKEEPTTSAPKAPAASGGDLRSSLMAAIREAGGSGKASLRSAKDRKYEAKKKKQDEKEKNITNELEEGGDLMADLKNTLAMRRKGISGIPDGQKRVAGVGEIMLSLASAIPTIDNSAESSTGAAGGSDDDDWD